MWARGFSASRLTIELDKETEMEMDMEMHKINFEYK